MKVYFLPITNTNWERHDTELLHYLSEYRKNKVLAYRYDIDKKLCLYAALLVRMKLILLTGIPNNKLNFSFLSTKKPVFLSNSLYHFNFSHTRNAILCGISYSNNIGVDIENINTAPFEIIDSTFHSDEKNYVISSKSPDIAFYEIWTQKEAYMKYKGVGLNDDLTLVNTKHPKLLPYFLTWKNGNYICSIFSYDISSVNIETINEKQIIQFFL